MNTYTTRSITVQAVKWDGSNTGEVAAFAGPENVRDEPGGLGVHNGEDWVLMHPGWWVSKSGDGEITVHAGKAFDELFSPA